MNNQGAAAAVSGQPCASFLSFLAACANLQSLFFSALGRKFFLGHSCLINHLVLLVTPKGRQSSLLYLLSAGEPCLCAEDGRRTFCSQRESSDPKCNNFLYPERIFARSSTAALFMSSSQPAAWLFFFWLSQKRMKMYCRAPFSDCIQFPDVFGLTSCVNSRAHSAFVTFLFRFCQLLLLTLQMIQPDIRH